MHAAYGREFRHVVMLDGGDWREKSDAERRLYYVGMTRAKENLVLCQSVRGANPFSPPLGGESIVRTGLSKSLQRPKNLGWKYLPLRLADVDLGFGGRQAPGHAFHRAVEQLEYAEPLDVVVEGDAGETMSSITLPRASRASTPHKAACVAQQSRPGRQETL